MKILPVLAAASFCAIVGAQSPLAVIPVAPVGYFGYNTPSNDTNVYFNLTATGPVTLQAIETPVLSPVGQQGTLSVYTCPTTHVGNELTATAWTLVATGAITGRGTTGSLANLTAVSCQENAVVPNTGFLLNPGSYGIAVRYQGVTPLLVGVGVLQTFTNAELSVSSGALQYTAFTSALQAPATAQGYTAWCFRGNIVYANGAAPHACAEALPYGEGCYKTFGSPHQEFTDSTPGGPAAAAALALNGRNLQFVPTGNSYTLVQGTTAFLPPSGTVTTIALGDDAEAQVTLPAPFVYPGGVATDFFVHSNGFISVASNNTLPGGLTWVPSIQPFLNAPATAWWSWHDYNPAEAGSGQVVWEQVGSKLVFTWNGVESYPTTAVNLSTWQMQFDTANGFVDFVWQTIDPVGGSGFLEGDDHLVGYSPGGASPVAPQMDVTTVNGLSIPFPEIFPLTLATTAKPILGTTISLDTTNPSTAFGIGINFVGTVQIPTPGFDLGIIGAGGCPAFLDPNAAVGNAISNTGLFGLTMSVNFPLPVNPAFAGLAIYSQSVWLDAAANAAGLITSNGVELLLGNF